MGNAIHRMNIHFTDSDWRNVLSVVNTDISGEGTVVIEAVRNGTEKWVVTFITIVSILLTYYWSLRHVRSASVTWSGDIDQLVSDMVANIPIAKVNPLCELVVDALTFINLILFICNMSLIRTC